MLSHDPRRRLAPRLAVSKDGAQVRVIEVRKVARVELPSGRIIMGQRLAQLRRLGDAAAAAGGRPNARPPPPQRGPRIQASLPAATPLTAPRVRLGAAQSGENDASPRWQAGRTQTPGAASSS